jgi:branched-chain amino acid transport system substrate-binding protein
MPERGIRRSGGRLLWEVWVSAARFARAVTAVAILSLAVTACAAKNSSTSSGSGSGSGSSSTSGRVNLPAVSTLPVPADAVKPAGNGQAKCSGVTLAYVGAESGANAQLGINIYNGVQLAINQHNQANPGCQVTFKKFDTAGDQAQAPGVVTQVVSEKDIIGVLGLPFSGESQSTGTIFQQNGLVHITPSATNPTLAQQGWTTFFRALGNDNVQGPAAAKFITGKLKAKKVCVIQDDSDYGIGLSTAITKALGSAADTACADKVTTGQKDFSSTVSKVNAAKPDAVFYSGYYAEGAPFDQQLVNGGYQGIFVGPDGVKDPKFIQQAGPASSNAYFTCPCVPGELIPAFASAYKGVSHGSAPGTYSLEGYDSATIMLAGIDKGIKDRPGMLNFVKNYNADGFSKHFQWQPNGELAKSTVYGYKVQNGQIVYVGTIG